MFMDATVESIVLVLIIPIVVIAPYAPLDTIVQVGIIKHKNMPVQPASTRRLRVLPQHPRARTVQPASIMTARVLPRHPRARTVQPASILTARVLPQHPCARTVQPGKSVKRGLQNVSPSANQGHTIPVAAYAMNVRQEDGHVQ